MNLVASRPGAASQRTKGSGFLKRMEIAPLPERLTEAVVDLWHQVGLTRPWNDPGADLSRAMRGPASAVLAGFIGGDLIATAMVGHDGHRGWVYYLAVHPNSQGNGHGREMMAACERWLTERGIPKINLMVRADNPVARGFYAAIGYGQDEVIVLSRRLGTPGQASRLTRHDDSAA
jgi:ribosomal protein S18 acetylase RimI-like enzyme